MTTMNKKEAPRFTPPECNQDNITEAIHGLDIFTKNFCMNVKATEEKDDLVFRCNECEFRSGKDCLIKIFAGEHESDYPMDNFGSMGKH